MLRVLMVKYLLSVRNVEILSFAFCAFWTMFTREEKSMGVKNVGNASFVTPVLCENGRTHWSEIP